MKTVTAHKMHESSSFAQKSKENTYKKQLEILEKQLKTQQEAREKLALILKEYDKRILTLTLLIQELGRPTLNESKLLREQLERSKTSLTEIKRAKRREEELQVTAQFFINKKISEAKEMGYGMPPDCTWEQTILTEAGTSLSNLKRMHERESKHFESLQKIVTEKMGGHCGSLSRYLRGQSHLLLWTHSSPDQAPLEESALTLPEYQHRDSVNV
ncbi:MAG: hypothetical protein A3F10_02350 [Coxiella sp. RIFCSPHIGHO2_12_FULL_42_15]|nr:MAG: hypothetical protein A3F10_02350 [Coxiella sp. RIFCSPHIGHO2_12_FULL_42_15]